MSLPVILELAIGLVFIYLTLSLVASELQEIISTLLQWRAEHLKHAIEQLLAGSDRKNMDNARNFADRLYNSSVIQSLNQEAEGRLARSIRNIIHSIGSVYRGLSGSRNVFGDRTSGPSYIPADAFANSLLDQLQLDYLGQILVDSRLRRFMEDQLHQPLIHILNDLKVSRPSPTTSALLDAELKQFEAQLGQILDDFQTRRATLSTTLDRLLFRLEEFSQLAQAELPDDHLSQTFVRRIDALRRNLAATADEKAILLQKIQPSLTELVAILDGTSATHRELAAIATQTKSASLQQLLKQLQTDSLPHSLRANLLSLANHAQQQVSQTAGASLDHLEHQIETWFNQSMERASGVYRRNAKGVGLILGFAIAITLNADSFHIANHLLNDSTLRGVIGNSAQQLTLDSPDDITTITDSVSSALDQIPIPLGRSQTILAQQTQAEANWGLPIPRRWLGWLITGFAIAMGANFWFNALRRLINIRSTGNPPEKSS
jgi:hypothetical protein